MSQPAAQIAALRGALARAIKALKFADSSEARIVSFSELVEQLEAVLSADPPKEQAFDAAMADAPVTRSTKEEADAIESPFNEQVSGSGQEGPNA